MLDIEYLHLYTVHSFSLLIKLDKLQVFNYVGKYSNVIERTRAAEIALSIQQHKDLGCQAVQIITINEDKLTCTKNQVERFWHYLGVRDSRRLNGTFPYRFFFITFNISYCLSMMYLILLITNIYTVTEAGNPDEDELYESAIIDTNMMYELKNEQLVPRKKLWGTLPKIEMLDKNKVIYYL